MSGLEIERKFLVRKKGGEYKKAAFSVSHIKQGYIPADGATVRIRVRDEQAFLTIKSRSLNGGLTRYEFEIEIPYADADASQDKIAKLTSVLFVERVKPINIADKCVKSDSLVLLVKTVHIPKEIVNIIQAGELVPLGMPDQVTVFGQLNALCYTGFDDLNIRIRL